MPINICRVSGKRGFKWGKHGKCYPSRSKARKQGVAILISEGRIKIKRRKR